MEKKAEKIHDDQWLKDLPIQGENFHFKNEELVVCRKCARTNPPTRLNCFYCAAELELSEAQSRFLKPNLRRLENWEKGFNLILTNKRNDFDQSKSSEVAKILKFDEDSLKKLIETEKSLPLARVESRKEAEIIQNLLAEFNFQTSIVSDVDLSIEKPLRRLRSIEFSIDKIILTLFNLNETVEIAQNDLALIVTGAVFERRVESTEKRVKKGDNKILQATETASDELLIDIYDRQETVGYRIFAKGFDFSCLQAEKGILAAENLKKLARKLREFAPESKFDDDYLKIREALGNVWQVEEKNDSQGVKREVFGSFHLENVTTINNLSQFTKYSRLQRQLL